MTSIYGKINDYRLNNKGKAKQFIDIVELLLASGSFPLAIWITGLFTNDLAIKPIEGIFYFIIVMITWFVLSQVTSMAKIPRTQRYITLAFQFSRNSFISLLIFFAVKVVFRFTTIPVTTVLILVGLQLVIILGFRIFAYMGLKIYRQQGKSAHHVLILADAFSDGVIESLLSQKEWGFRISSIMTNSKLIKAKYGSFIEIVSPEKDIKQLIDHQVIDEVMYCRRDVDIDLIRNIGEICNEVGVIFRLQSSVSPLDPTEFQLKTMNKAGELSIVDTPSNSLSFFLKTIGDTYFSVIALILLSPLFLLLSLLIVFTSKGPVFFKQERVGLRGRKFMLYKFRTMVVDAEKQLKKLREKNEADGPVFKMKDDPRITSIGKFLRKTGLDELPQLLNVIRGEMSLIGPRPPLEAEVKQYERWQLRRLSVKPGITCTWQIVPDRHEVSFEEWMQLDLNYIDNWNLRKDFGLFFKTVKSFFVAGGH